MYHNPRRPFYNARSEDIPQDNSAHHSAVIDSKRFWKLLKKLTLRKDAAKEAKAANKDKAATG
ncbi:MAG: hypothetical protein Q9P01_17925 [Anaerolineae bacterium]|nr:hypothetical protein [Anaerolineae bacterium]MDQ7036634.1 hypothetical protein [Anaerolineae bacterium]